MNSAERRYLACERQALFLIFPLGKSLLYLLSTDWLVLIMDQQALKAAFSRNDIHGRQAQWLEFLAEYDFTFQFRKGHLSGTADFLSQSLQTKQKRASISRHAKWHVLWHVCLYRRTKRHMFVDFPLQLREVVLKYLHDENGH